MTRVVGYFVSPHGFGHAARACAVMGAAQEIAPDTAFEVFTTVPRWFFEESLTGNFGYHAEPTDIGLVQESPLHEDVAATIERLDKFYPFEPSRLERLASQVQELECQCIVCDISPLGIAVAHAAGLPAILVENFTWDWIYQGYVQDDWRILKHATYCNILFNQADFHIQTEPVCVYKRSDLVTAPVSRSMRTAPAAVHDQLGIPRDALIVLITMGGIPGRPAFVDSLAAYPGAYFVIPGAAETVERHGNTMLLPHHSSLYHPDLVNACDAIVGKNGYSTVAEAYAAGVPFGYVTRPRFRESEVLAQYIRREMTGIEIREQDLQSGAWLAALPDLLALPRITRSGPSGAAQVAEFVTQVARHERP